MCRAKSFSGSMAAVLMAVCACSSSESAGTQSQGGNAAIGGLPGYDYPNDAGYGGYAGFSSQPWGGDNATTAANTGGNMGVSGGAASSGGTTATSQSVAAGGAIGTGGATGALGGVSSTVTSSATGGALSTGGRSSGTGGRSSSGGTSSTTSASVTGGAATVTGGTRSTGGAASTGGSPVTGGASSTGGVASTGGASSSTSGFDWGTSAYSVTGGANVGHQTHNAGSACLASCHSHSFQVGGTVYAADGTTGAANVQIGIRTNGALFAAYSGSRGNFYMPIGATVDWSTVQIAIRNSNGTIVHPTTSGLSGNCNSCHGSSNRIVQP